MKSRRQIQNRLNDEADNTDFLAALEWVLEPIGCPMCNVGNRRELEVKVHRGEVTPTFLETKNQWPVGTVMSHMDEHLEYDPAEAAHMEKMRGESISTLNVAEDLAQRLVSWVGELEARKIEEGLTSEWIGDATKLLNQGQGFLKLIGQLKKEIGVDSQLLLADRKVENMMGILVDVLKNEPVYLDQIQLRLATLTAPTNHIQEADFEVVEDGES